ncbi:Transcription factor MBP, partial [Dispira simplex]
MLNVPPELYRAVYAGVEVVEYHIAESVVMRRKHDNYINITQIFKVAGLDKSKRTRCLERRVHNGVHEKVQGGYGRYQGTWVPLEKAVDLVREFGLWDRLKGILELDSQSIPLLPEVPRAYRLRTPRSSTKDKTELTSPLSTTGKRQRLVSNEAAWKTPGRGTNHAGVTPLAKRTKGVSAFSKHGSQEGLLGGHVALGHATGLPTPNSASSSQNHRPPSVVLASPVTSGGDAYSGGWAMAAGQRISSAMTSPTAILQGVSDDATETDVSDCDDGLHSGFSPRPIRPTCHHRQGQHRVIRSFSQTHPLPRLPSSIASALPSPYGLRETQANMGPTRATLYPPRASSFSFPSATSPSGHISSPLAGNRWVSSSTVDNTPSPMRMLRPWTSNTPLPRRATLGDIHSDHRNLPTPIRANRLSSTPDLVACTTPPVHSLWATSQPPQSAMNQIRPRYPSLGVQIRSHHQPLPSPKRNMWTAVPLDHLHCRQLLDYFRGPHSESLPTWLQDTSPQSFEVNAPLDDQNNTSLHWALMTARVEAIERLLSLKANSIQLNAHQESPLMVAVQYDRWYSIRKQYPFRHALYLMNQGVSYRTSNGWTLLHYLVDLTRYETLRSQVLYYIDEYLTYIHQSPHHNVYDLFWCRDKQGRTALDLAEYVAYPEGHQLLCQFSQRVPNPFPNDTPSNPLVQQEVGIHQNPRSNGTGGPGTKLPSGSLHASRTLSVQPSQGPPLYGSLDSAPGIDSSMGYLSFPTMALSDMSLAKHHSTTTIPPTSTVSTPIRGGTGMPNQANVQTTLDSAPSTGIYPPQGTFEPLDPMTTKSDRASLAWEIPGQGPSETPKPNKCNDTAQLVMSHPGTKFMSRRRHTPSPPPRLLLPQRSLPATQGPIAQPLRSSMTNGVSGGEDNLYQCTIHKLTAHITNIVLAKRQDHQDLLGEYKNKQAALTQARKAVIAEIRTLHQTSQVLQEALSGTSQNNGRICNGGRSPTSPGSVTLTEGNTLTIAKSTNQSRSHDLPPEKENQNSPVCLRQLAEKTHRVLLEYFETRVLSSPTDRPRLYRTLSCSSGSSAVFEVKRGHSSTINQS